MLSIAPLVTRALPSGPKTALRTDSAEGSGGAVTGRPDGICLGPPFPSQGFLVLYTEQKRKRTARP